MEEDTPYTNGKEGKIVYMKINNKYMTATYDTPSRPPVVNRLVSESLKDKINIIPDDFEIFINDNLL